MIDGSPKYRPVIHDSERGEPQQEPPDNDTQCFGTRSIKVEKSEKQLTELYERRQKIALMKSRWLHESPTSLTIKITTIDPQALYLPRPEMRVLLLEGCVFPEHTWEVMNRHLLADFVIKHFSENPGGMFRKSIGLKPIKHAISVFYENRLPDEILNSPLGSAQLFKKMHETHKLFTSETFLLLAKEIKYEVDKPEDQKDYEMRAAENILTQAEQNMTTDDRDRLTVSMKVMRYAYFHAPIKSKNEDLDAAVSKEALAGIFAESAFPHTEEMSAAYGEKENISVTQTLESKVRPSNTRRPHSLATLFMQCTSSHSEQEKKSSKADDRKLASPMSKEEIVHRRMIMEVILRMTE
ncbi:hypothetical protein [Endozoicomonas sp.]|uniref:hypothetical protein n=1 Tax=Endozoicomonas sp. TaxID=1892382 RepID=UPI003AF8A99E